MMTEPTDPTKPQGTERLNEAVRFHLDKNMGVLREEVLSSLKNSFAWQLQEDMASLDELGKDEAQRAGLYVVPVTITPPFDGECTALSCRFEYETQADGDRDVLLVYIPIEPDTNPYETFKDRHLPPPEFVYFARAKQIDTTERITSWYKVGRHQLSRADLDEHGGGDKSVQFHLCPT